MLVPFSTHRPRCGSAGSSRGCNGYNRACNGYNCACNGYNRACNADGSTVFVHVGHTGHSCWTRSSTRRARRGRASERRRWRSTRVRSAVCDRSATAEQILLVLPRVPSTILYRADARWCRPLGPSTNTIVVALTATSQPNKHTKITVQVLRAASRVLRVASVRMHVAWCGDARCILSDARVHRLATCCSLRRDERHHRAGDLDSARVLRWLPLRTRFRSSWSLEGTLSLSPVVRVAGATVVNGVIGHCRPSQIKKLGWLYN
jgi:hypothetical protein